ncbi:unnamed protein product [Blepharisma stoltei]|uniref:Response regulatory domain-containing protein n=1 Tax=Blepharisma stoltei TaxID=1481888 RepID=A0AAU9JEA2_9CILI|nr:unnamed protein product [Blepharisma stoltei]
MDGSMPEMNGWDATKRITLLHKSKVITNLPVVIGYTAFTSEADLALCLESGMKECLIKPGNPKSLLDVIHRYLLM